MQDNKTDACSNVFDYFIIFRTQLTLSLLQVYFKTLQTIHMKNTVIEIRMTRTMKYTLIAYTVALVGMGIVLFCIL